MRVGIVGSGATGGFLAAALALSHTAVTLLARGDSYSRILRDGIEVTYPDGRHIIARPANVMTPGDTSVEPVDLVLFCVKSYDTDDAAASVKSLAGESGLVLCLQNGVKNEEALAGVIDPQRLLSGVLYIGSRRLAPGVIECSAPPRIHFGWYAAGRALEDLNPIANIFKAADIDAVADADIRQEKWQKFLFNCALNPLTAIVQRPLGEILDLPSGRELYGALLDEAIAVGQAQGAPLVSDARDRVWATGRRMNILSSMAEDLRAQRPLELDAFTGYVHELGRLHGIQTPISDTVLALLEVASHRNA